MGNKLGFKFTNSYQTQSISKACKICIFLFLVHLVTASAKIRRLEGTKKHGSIKEAEVLGERWRRRK